MYSVIIFTNFLSVLFVRFHIKYVEAVPALLEAKSGFIVSLAFYCIVANQQNFPGTCPHKEFHLPADSNLFQQMEHTDAVYLLNLVMAPYGINAGFVTNIVMFVLLQSCFSIMLSDVRPNV